jgi:hypothetical protein
MEMDLYKFRILDGVLMVLVQTRNCMSPCLKSYGLCLNYYFGTKRTHSPLPGLMGEALFLELSSFFDVFADSRLVRICISLSTCFDILSAICFE